MLSKKVKYAFLALQYIIDKSENEPVKIQEIASGAKLPRKFLEGILAELKKAEILESRRGWTGGYLLRKKPAELRYWDIIRIIDGPIELTHCSLSGNQQQCSECRHLRPCPFKAGFQKSNSQIISTLQSLSFQKSKKK